tara:strand:- start:1574 stop:1867 length:294 start_codon:yes stop_codon:yes gene_type:complete
MSSYVIKPLQTEKATKLKVTIKPSTNKKKKIDVYNKDDKKIASIGAFGYKDYATYLTLLTKAEANKKRKNYLARHAKEPKTKDGKKTNSYWADKILW